MASWLMRSTEEKQSGFGPWLGTLCCIFRQTTLLSQWLVNLMLGDNPTMDLHPIQGGVERWKYSWSLYAIETGISSSLINHSTHM